MSSKDEKTTTSSSSNSTALSNPLRPSVPQRCAVCQDVTGVLYCEECTMYFCTQNRCDTNFHLFPERLTAHTRRPVTSSGMSTGSATNNSAASYQQLMAQAQSLLSASNKNDPNVNLSSLSTLLQQHQQTQQQTSQSSTDHDEDDSHENSSSAESAD